MKRFIYIKSTHDMTEIQNEMDALFSSLVDVFDMVHEKNSTLYIYQGFYDLDFEEITMNMLSDTLYDLVLYQSFQFEDMKELLSHVDFVKTYLEFVPKKMGSFINHQKLLKSNLNLPKQLLSEQFLRKYAKDHMMLDTLYIYFENNQNMSKAAKELYIHRNTLIQRLDKFLQETGFDVRKFQDAVIIYQLIS